MNGNELKTLRAGAGLTQAELARRMSVDVSTVSRWERGESKISQSTEIAIRAVIRRKK